MVQLDRMQAKVARTACESQGAACRQQPGCTALCIFCSTPSTHLDLGPECIGVALQDGLHCSLSDCLIILVVKAAQAVAVVAVAAACEALTVAVKEDGADEQMSRTYQYIYIYKYQYQGLGVSLHALCVTSKLGVVLHHGPEGQRVSQDTEGRSPLKRLKLINKP
jgi:hypothetical protein